MGKILNSPTELPLDKIEAKDRLRPVSDAGVEAIMASIGEMGVMKDPIHVRKMRGGAYRLLAGGHRLEAARRLGWDTIKVTAWDCNDTFAQLVEIDDNLAGSELTVLDTAVFLAARKAVYEKLHPGSGHGGARGNQHTGGWQTETISFCHATAEKLGITERHVNNLVRAGQAVSGHAEKLRQAPKSVGLNDLLHLSKINTDEERGFVVEALAEGTFAKASQARKAWHAKVHGTKPPEDNTDQRFRLLWDAFERAPKAARRRFFEQTGRKVLDAALELIPADVWRAFLTDHRTDIAALTADPETPADDTGAVVPFKRQETGQ